MKNPWLEVPLDDYESHMGLAEVGQAQLLADLLRESVETYKPSSLAILGCAGGNGLEGLSSTSVRRAVGIDINEAYLARAAARYKDQIPVLELFAGDLAVDRFDFEPVELVFAGLIFEYVESAVLLKQALSMLTRKGVLITVVQLPSSIDEVTPSPYTSLKSISSVWRVVSSETMTALARAMGFEAQTEHVVTASGGKLFQVNAYRSPSGAALEKLGTPPGSTT